MHAIRLRRPWEKQTGNCVAQVDVPDAAAGIVPLVVYRRRFNRPTGLGAQDVVMLEVSDWQGRLTSLLLNESPIDVGKPPLRVDVTAALNDHNQLELTLQDDGKRPPLLTGDVTLVIQA